MASFDVDSLDPDEYFADYERRALERRARRSNKRTRRRRGFDGSDRGEDSQSLGSSTGGRVLLSAVIALALATVVGLMALWPYGHTRTTGSQSYGQTVQARVLGASSAPCAIGEAVSCRSLEISVGAHHTKVTLGPVNTAPDITRGTAIRVSRVPLQRGKPAPPGYEPYEFVEIDRHGSLILIGLLTLALSLIVIRWRGLLAALGVGLSLLLVLTFLVPAILQGKPALLVALVSALAVMFVTLILTNGFGAQTLAAALGIGSTLILTSLLALLCVHLAKINGRTDELSADLADVNHLSLQGIVLAGMMIGALGVLADTAVTQASAVMALRRADQTLDQRGLYNAAIRVGRDHLSATIHTLVLAYVGSCLPLLLITRLSGVGFLDAVNTQDLAEPILATLVGCAGLICAVPLTTGLASMLVSRVPPTALNGAHAHHHH